jgi:hypothetical protein
LTTETRELIEGGRESVKMSLVTELIAPPSHIHSRIAEFERDFVEFASSVPPRSPLRQELSPLSKDLSDILVSLTRPNLDAAATSKIIDRWDEWSERFGAVTDPLFDEELEHLFIALPS